LEKAQIQDLLSKYHNAFIEMISNLDLVDLTKSSNEKWSSIQQLDHIYRSVNPLTKIMISPEILESFNFGKKADDSREYDEIVNYYQTTLSTGVKARGQFVPLGSDELDITALANQLNKSVHQLIKNIGQFSTEQLDTFLIPHPVLGPLSVKEMMYFTIYHVQHHHKQALSNLSLSPT